MNIKQTIENLDHGIYSVQIELPDNQLITRTYERSNEIFPAYKTLVEVLRRYDGVGIYVETNCKALAKEYNAEYQNRNSKLLNELQEIIARRGLSVTIDYVA